jgi:all-trans-retinol 13,14-reductase
MYIHLQRLRPVVEKAKNIDKKDVLSQGFSQKKVKDMGKFDCIIIGSGMGGLTAAALLSRIGKKVLLLEQHDILGGCTHTFTEEGFEFDTGLHYLGRDVTTPLSPLGFMFHLLGMGNLKWSKMGKTYDHAIISPELSKQTNHFDSVPPTPSSLTNMEFTDDLDDTVKRLVAAFPEEEEAIQHYLRLLKWGKIAFGMFIALKMAPKAIGAFLGMIVGQFLNAFVGTSSLQVI